MEVNSGIFSYAVKPQQSWAQLHYTSGDNGIEGRFSSNRVDCTKLADEGKEPVAREGLKRRGGI